MTQELNLQGEWWLPDREIERFQGTLVFSQEHKRGVLSINSRSAFEISEMGNRNKKRHDIILGQTLESQKVTLVDCEIIGFYLIKAENILLEAYFKRPQDIIFSSIYITYLGSQINKWFERAYRQAWTKSRSSFQARIKDNYIINILPKPRRISTSEQAQKETSGTLCVRIESLKVKTLEEYFKVNRVIFDFLNLIIPGEEVHIESIYGIREQREGSNIDSSIKSREESEPAEVFYKSAISQMFKPWAKIKQPLFPYDNSQLDSLQDLFQKYLSEWFGLHDKPAVQLYCAVMSNAEMYDVYLFLALAQALESYHDTFIQTESQIKKNRKEKMKCMHYYYHADTNVYFV